MFTMQPIGFVKSPYQNRNDVPRGLGAKHDAEGVLEILPEFEPGLMDIEGFSHLFVIWCLIAPGDANCWPRHRATTGSTEFLRPARRIRSG